MVEHVEKYNSELEDDPDVYESSGEEWEEDSEKKRSNRRTSRRLRKKPRISHLEVSSDSEEEAVKSKNGVREEPKQDTTEAPSRLSTPGQQAYNLSSLKKYPTPGTEIITNDFVNGGFLISKKDAQLGDPSKHPCLWRIDGKALLQKYEPFEEDGVIRHKNTSIYTGWSSLDKDLYYPVTIKVVTHQGHNMTVEFNWENLKEINNESE